MTNIYLDHAATTQIDVSVLNAMRDFELAGRANVNRGLYPWAERATLAFENARKTVAAFVGAEADELAFMKSATEGLNLVAKSLARDMGNGDNVVVTLFEHHSSVLPWREAAKEWGFEVRVIGVRADGTLDMDVARKLIDAHTKAVVATHVSNVLGTILPVRELADLAHGVNAVMVVDAAQSVGHIPVAMNELGADALAFSAHKMYGPMGIGALVVGASVGAYCNTPIHPMFFGGGMVDDMRGDGVSYVSGVRGLEAGTPNVTGAIGFAAAVRALAGEGMATIAAREAEVTSVLVDGLRAILGVRVYSLECQPRVGIVSFRVDGVHPHDLAERLGERGVMVRAGYHCAVPLCEAIAPLGTVRMSIGRHTSAADMTLAVTILRDVLAAPIF